MLIIFPWSMVLFLSWLVNKWQLPWRPIGQLIWWLVDQLDQRAPGLVEWLLWLQGLISLGLHIVTVGVNLGVVWVSDDGRLSWRQLPGCQIFWGAGGLGGTHTNPLSP